MFIYQGVLKKQTLINEHTLVWIINRELCLEWINWKSAMTPTKSTVIPCWLHERVCRLCQNSERLCHSLKECSDSNKESFCLHIGVETNLGVKTILRKGHNDPSSISAEKTHWDENDSFVYIQCMLRGQSEYRDTNWNIKKRIVIGHYYPYRQYTKLFRFKVVLVGLSRAPSVFLRILRFSSLWKINTSTGSRRRLQCAFRLDNDYESNK